MHGDSSLGDAAGATRRAIRTVFTAPIPWFCREMVISLRFNFGSPYYGHAYRPYHAYPVAPRRHYGGGAWEAHVAYCYDRWRSYRASDNTYQPFNGPRRECRSPYFG